jgi:purine-binding chemotaxis protein CheW
MANEPLKNDQLKEKQVVVFKLGQEEFGANIETVKEIRKMDDQKITPVPKTKEFVAGIVNLRGKIIPVLDLRVRFGMEKTTSEDNRIIVIEVQNEVCGVVVDAVNEVLRIPYDNIEPAPEMVAGINKDYLEGIAKVDGRLIININLPKIALANTNETIAS